MLIEGHIVKNIINQYNINITGILHIGAHECEELGFYVSNLNVLPENIIWIDAIDTKVQLNINNGIPNVYHNVITDKDDDIVEFNISNNFQSSSIFELGDKHIEYYPHIHYTDKIKQKTITIDTFYKKNNLDPSKYVFWNFDIQGAELLALKGGSDAIKHVKMLYLEVNRDEMYKNCDRVEAVDSFLLDKGFKRVHDTISDGTSWGDAIYVRN